MSYRRSSIDNINRKYRASTAGRSPVTTGPVIGQGAIRQTGSVIGAGGLRPSVIGGSPISRPSVIGQPIAQVGRQTSIAGRPSVIGQQGIVGGIAGVGGVRRSIVGTSPVFGVSPPQVRRSIVGGGIAGHVGGTVVTGPSTINRGYGGSVIGGGVQNRVTTGVVGAGFPTSNLGGFRRSVVQPVTTVGAIQTPAVYQVQQNPPIIQAITTPPKVFEIVQPIIQVTPDVVHERKVEHVTTPPPSYIPRKGRGARGYVEDVKTQDCCSSCPWWLWTLLCLLLLLGLLSGLLYAFRNQLGGIFNKDNSKTTEVEKKIENKTNQTTGGNTGGNDDDTDDEQTTQTGNNNGKGIIPEEDKNQQTNDEGQNDKGENLILKSGGKPKTEDHGDEKQINTVTITNVTCQAGYFFYKNKCIACPNGSLWNGQSCVKKVLVQQPPKPKPTTSSEQKQEDNKQSNETQTIQWNTNVDPKRQLCIEDAWSIIKPQSVVVKNINQGQTSTSTTTTVSSSTNSQTGKSQGQSSSNSTQTKTSQQNNGTSQNNNNSQSSLSNTTTTIQTKTTSQSTATNQTEGSSNISKDTSETNSDSTKSNSTSSNNASSQSTSNTSNTNVQSSKTSQQANLIETTNTSTHFNKHLRRGQFIHY